MNRKPGRHPAAMIFAACLAFQAAMLPAGSPAIAAAPPNRARAVHPAGTRANRPDAMAYWSGRPRFGANCMDTTPPTTAYLRAARAQGIQWIRLAWDKWRPARRDFLLGDADHYQGLVEADLDVLKAALDRAHGAGLKVVLVPLSLPGMRWSQNNGGRFDGRIWQDRAWWSQAERFWADLAAGLRGHPALVAYNLVNEPAPEKPSGLPETASAAAWQAWYTRIQGTAADLPAFYDRMIRSIRAVDPEVPVMLDSGWYAKPAAFACWPRPARDPRVLYSFHMYEPYSWSNPANHRRPEPFTYPGAIPDTDGILRYWNRAAVADHLAAPFAWARTHGIPANRMVAGEFGCHRRSPGAAAYLEDVLAALDRHGCHWAFYAFRESYDGFDYELGVRQRPWAPANHRETARRPRLSRKPDPLYAPIARRLRRR